MKKGASSAKIFVNKMNTPDDIGICIYIDLKIKYIVVAWSSRTNRSTVTTGTNIQWWPLLPCNGSILKIIEYLP